MLKTRLAKQQAPKKRTGKKLQNPEAPRIYDRLVVHTLGRATCAVVSSHKDYRHPRPRISPTRVQLRKIFYRSAASFDRYSRSARRGRVHASFAIAARCYCRFCTLHFWVRRCLD